VFATSYAAVDHELPALMARERPDILVMFGLAPRSRHIRIETRARNALTGRVADVSGHRPAERMIAPGGRAMLPLRVPAQRLVAAVRRTGIPAAISRDAGAYLCNYVCWRATEAAERMALRAWSHSCTCRIRVGRTGVWRACKRGDVVGRRSRSRTSSAPARPSCWPHWRRHRCGVNRLTLRAFVCARPPPA